MTRDERIWSSIKFTPLLCSSVALPYILLCKHITPIPESITGNAVTEINDTETILEDQEEMSEKLIMLKKDINSSNFEIQQTQRISEIKNRMTQLQDNYRKHSYDPKYLYRMRAFKTIQDYFDIKQKLYWITKNTEDRKKILEGMKTKIR